MHKHEEVKFDIRICNTNEGFVVGSEIFTIQCGTNNIEMEKVVEMRDQLRKFVTDKTKEIFGWE